MARPRILRTEAGGEITLKNVEPDTVAAIEKLLSGGQAEAVKSEESPIDEEKVNYTAVALSVCMKGGQWGAAVVNLDPDTGAAKMQTFVACVNEMTAVERFKILAVENNLV